MNRYRVIADPDSPTGIELRGGNRAMLANKDNQVIVAGPSETGKTMACCVKMHLTCLKYPKAQGAMVRKSYASITGTCGRTFERVIQGWNVRTFGGAYPSRYIYPNGSSIWIGGMDNPDKVLSSERDFVYVNQAEELTVKDWEMLSTRTTGRGAVVPNPQLMGDCNPSGSKHWIRQKAADGTLTLLNTTHKDNPTLFDKAGNILPQGEKSLGVLKTLSGVRRKRLLDGIWATAEGAVYDMFDPSIHVKVRSRNEMKRFFLAMDDGFTNPAVILDIGEDSDGRWHCFREFYQRGQMRETVVATAKQWHNEFRREVVAVDEAVPELVAQLCAAGMNAVGGKGKVQDGIRKMQDRLAIKGDGLPRYTIDPSCVEHQNEFESYVYKEEKDEPVKEYDHSLDACRYLCDVLAEPDGAMRNVGDLWTKPRDEAYGSVTSLRLPADSFRI